MLHIIISEDKIYYGNSFDFNQNERYFYFKENSLLGKFDFVFDFVENEELKKKISTIENNLLFL